jgi:hypothetical protein
MRLVSDIAIAAEIGGVAEAIRQVGAQLAEMTEVLRADGAARADVNQELLALQKEWNRQREDDLALRQAELGSEEATPEQPEPAAAQEGRYLQEHCGCEPRLGWAWHRDHGEWGAWLCQQSGRSLYSGEYHCGRCGSSLLSPAACSAIGQPPGTAVAFAPVGDEVGERWLKVGLLGDALRAANAKLCAAEECLLGLRRLADGHQRHRDGMSHDPDCASWVELRDAIYAARRMDLNGEALPDGTPVAPAPSGKKTDPLSAALARANEKLNVAKRLADNLREEVAQYTQWLGHACTPVWDRVARASLMLTNLNLEEEAAANAD